MKTKFYLIAFLLMASVGLMSCGGGSKVVEYTNADQNQYSMAIYGLHGRYEQSPNDIGKKEIAMAWAKYVTGYFDSLPQVIGWRGRIGNIKASGTDASKAVSCEISFGTAGNSGRTAFVASYLVSGDSIKTSKVYNALKNLKESDLVIFSGEVLRQNNEYTMSDSTIGVRKLGEPMFDEEGSSLFNPKILFYLNDIQKSEE